jgi:iron complex transport system substrate-binding protein
MLLFLSFTNQFSSVCFADDGILRIVDDMGETVVFDRPAGGIVSLYAGHTENLVAIGAGDAIVAIGRTGDDDDAFGPNVRVLGVKPGIEQVIALSADVVLTRPMIARAQRPFYDALRSFGVKVLALDPPAWENFPDYVGLLADITGKGGEHEKMAAAALDEAMAFVPGSEQTRPGVFLVTNGKTMATCTPDSWAAHILEAAGFKNAAKDAAPVSPGSVIAGYGAERLLASDGEVEVILLQQGAMNTTRAADFMKDSRFEVMRAVRNGMVFDVAEADVSRPSLLRLRSGVLRALRELVEVGRRTDEPDK